MMKLIPFFMILNFASFLHGQDPEVEMQLGINYFKAGQKDLAKETFNKLLHEQLKTEERAAVLYNLATLLLQDGALQEAKALFDQLEFMPIESKTLKVAILQNQALCSLELIKRALLVPLNAHDENSLFLIKQELSQLKKKLTTYKNLIFYEALLDELGKTEIQFQNFQFAYNLSKEGLEEQISTLTLYLFQKERDLFSYLSTKQDVKLYVEKQGLEVLPKLSQFGMRSAQDLVEQFIQERILQEQADLRLSYENKNGEDALVHIVRLISAYNLYKGYLEKKEVLTLLDERVYALGNEQLNPSFWQNELTIRNAQLVELLNLEIKRSELGEKSKDALTIKLFESFRARIRERQSSLDVLDDPCFYTILFQEEKKTFKAILDNAISKDELLCTLEALKSRLIVQKHSKAAEYIQEAEVQLQQNEYNAFQKSIQKAFSYLLPKESLIYELKKLEKSDNIQKDKGPFLFSFEAVKERLHPDTRKRIEQFLLFLNQKDTPYSSLSLQAIEFELLFRVAISEEDFKEALDFGMKYEKRILALQQELPVAFDEISFTYVQNLEKDVDRLPISKEDKDELKKDFQAVFNAFRSKLDVKRKHTMVLQLLEKIERMLQKQQEEQKSSQAENPKMIEQMNQNNLLLKPQESIRLLQDMEAEDESTKPESHSVTEVERPW